MLSNVPHIIAKLQGSLQAKDIDLASVSSMVVSTTKRLLELKEDGRNTSWYWKKRRRNSSQGVSTIPPSVIDHIHVMMESTELISTMSVFDPRHLPSTEEELSEYGMEQIKTLTDFYSVEQRINVGGDEGISQPDIEAKETESDWKLFRQ
ncbi:hypothetical protein LOD99_5471 [Oopsacas minuta]|uniref:Uncharacterized protein n=1 Tax=Oopsacas minuta TaxID=111878 RepID=A0AAV7JQQ8_9METZ|nr:hypothetical protein LOD99_5471 [Oopsacas minuta]